MARKDEKGPKESREKKAAEGLNQLREVLASHWTWSPPPEVGSIGFAIISHIQGSGKASFKNMAAHLGLTENKLQREIESLILLGYVRGLKTTILTPKGRALWEEAKNHWIELLEKLSSSKMPS